jgi:serine/threonine-protein kinase
VGRLYSSDSIDVGGFTPGTVLAGRYRVIGLLGRGGMGEVYRADDLTLGQPVALKFLPKTIGLDPVRRERLLAEVRIARQVSHPNLCRVYDIAELDGRHFLTMEYIDGEDLASLLKRIGSLHGAKALDVARQLCAGLAAAHDKGVLHRDLKPANVMIDGRGRVRITDFGIAVAATDADATADGSGTPAYMAPEQFTGQGASVRSDIHALGLVLYELYTGQRAFSASSLVDLRAQKEGATPTAPSEITRDIDPVIERVIVRCLAKDPRQRPSSVAQVAAALPGGDPLAAAIAAGETPSPEMVAAAGTTEGVRPTLAWAGLALAVLGVAAQVWLGPRTRVLDLAQADTPPDVLADRARTMLKQAGHDAPAADSAFGFDIDAAYMRYVKAHDLSPGRFDRLPASAFQFWYRQSPQPLEAYLRLAGPDRRAVGPDNPPVSFSGEALVWLDAHGRLVAFDVIPPQRDDTPARVAQTDWPALFADAGLDIKAWTPAEPQWTPLLYADTRMAWTGFRPERPDIPMRVEAAAYHGRAVSWRVIAPWDEPERLLLPSESKGPLIFAVSLFLTMLSAAVWLGRRNLRVGRGDRRGALRLATVIGTAYILEWVLADHHVLAIGELYLFMANLAWAIFQAALFWLAYIALEPLARRRWPTAMIGWSRLLAGGWRDPLVGRDALAGFACGAVATMVAVMALLIGPWSGNPGAAPGDFVSTVLLGAHGVAARVVLVLIGTMASGFAGFFLFFLVRLLIRRDWVAGAAIVALFGALNGIGDHSWLSAVIAMTIWSLLLFALLRFGIVALMSMGAFLSIGGAFPLTAQASAWYAGAGLVGVVLLLGLAVYAFYTSLGGQPVFGRVSLDE